MTLGDGEGGWSTILPFHFDPGTYRVVVTQVVGREESRRVGEDYLDRCIEADDAELPEPDEPQPVEH